MNAERVRWWCTKLKKLFRRRSQESDLDAEMRFHFDQLVEEFEAEGMSKSLAVAAAHREFGTTDSYREEIRDTWRPPALADLFRSLTSAVRSLLRTPGFTVLAIITLAFGIGANTAMYSVVNEVIFRPLPYPESDRMDRIYRSTTRDREGGFSAADYQELQKAAPVGYGEIASYAYANFSVYEPGQPAVFAPGLRVSSNLFRTFGIQPRLGREFESTEETLGNHRVVVISERYWQNRYDEDPAIVGRSIRVNGEPHEIVGVMPEAFSDWRFMGWVDIYRPLGLSADEITDRSVLLLNLVGRRSADIETEEASGFIANLGAKLAREFPEFNAEAAWRAVPLEVVKVGTGYVSLAMLIGLSGFVLLIACSNLANLLLARTMSRAREFALRSALGASRLQLLRPLILESLLLALAGGFFAVFVSVWGTDWMSHQTTDDQGSQVLFTTDWKVLAWALAASLVTALAFGLAPALYALRLDLNQTLKSGGRGASEGRGHQRLRSLLIIGQFALAMVLLSGAALFLRGLDDLNNRREGWESNQLVAGSILLPESNYPGEAEIITFQHEALRRLQELPVVESVSMSHALPFFGLRHARRLIVEGHELPEPGREPAAVTNAVSPGYFTTVGTRLHAGRIFSVHDHADSPPVFVINETMAHALFEDGNAVGHQMAFFTADEPVWGKIVGVVENTTSIYPETTPVAFQVYQPLAQQPQAFNEIAVRTKGPIPPTLVDRIRDIMADLDPALPVRNLDSANAKIERANYQPGVMGSMLSSFAVLGLALASLGIYGVIARTIAQRTKEFGIRLALGAQIPDITRLVLSSGLKLSIIGAVLGLGGAIGLARLISMNFPGMRMESAPAVIGATLLLTAVALLASYLPARRASKISPVEALRAE